MINSNRFNIAVGENVTAHDVGCVGATALACCRRVVDSQGFYSTSDIHNYTITVNRSFGTCPFSIVVDKVEGRILLEAKIIDTNNTIVDEIVDIVNEMNNELLYGFCILIDNQVIYQVSERFGGIGDDMYAAEAAHRIIEQFKSDYLTIMQGGYCDMSSIIEKDYYSKNLNLWD